MNLARLEWGFGIVLMLAAALVCLIPGEEIPYVFEFSDKLSHLVGHGALAAYFTGLVPRRSWWKIFLFLMLFGVAIEVAQHFMHVGRNGDPRDLVANVAGVSAGLLLGWMGLARWPELVSWLVGRRGATP
jgi:VanZ family protein